MSKFRMRGILPVSQRHFNWACACALQTADGRWSWRHSENGLKLKTVWQDYPERFMMRDGTISIISADDPAVTGSGSCGLLFSGLPGDSRPERLKLYLKSSDLGLLL